MIEDNESDGILGTIFGLLLLVVIWPYLLTIIGIFIAYVALLSIFNWITENLLLTICILLTLLGIICIFRYRLISGVYRYSLQWYVSKSKAVQLVDHLSTEGLSDLDQRKFIPSSNLYCYWCTKKLGIQAFEIKGKYYCQACTKKL